MQRDEDVILIIDDNLDNIRLLVEYLKTSGLKTAMARNGLIGLKRAEALQPALILLDVMMPGINGFETCRRLKANAATRHIPVIFMTALRDLSDKITAFACGGVDYITKPAHQQEVLARVQAHLALQTMQRRLHGQNMQLQQEIKDRERAEAELRSAHDELQTTLNHLLETQQQLIQSEKLASLGRVVAGIAHEIKNPLNFVNNFAQVITSMIDELRDIMEQEAARLPLKDADEIHVLCNDITRASEKILHHGERADQIVQNMLEHSAENTGQKCPIKLNALLEEYVNLSCQDAQMGEDALRLSIHTHYDPAIETIDGVAQGLGRVFLNLLQNACYALRQKQQNSGVEFVPTIWIDTKDRGAQVEIRIRDNGPGISEEHLAEVFTPFFTTKPPREGTGLGLSISHDIVVREHQGELRVHTEIGKCTEFILVLPKH